MKRQDDSSLPSSDASLAGATANSFGGLSEDEVRNGIGKIKTTNMPDDTTYSEGGFCGRPMGWER